MKKITNKEIMTHLLTIEVILKSAFNINPDEINEVLEDNRKFIEKQMEE